MFARCIRCRNAVCAGFVASALWSPAARAASVSWNAPSICPSQAQVLERIEAARGGPLGDGLEPSFTATVSREANGRLTLAVQAPTGEEGGSPSQTRVLNATQCEELVAALVQMVSLALGPATALESAPTEAAPAPKAGDTPPTPPSDGTEAVPPAKEEERVDEVDEPSLFRQKDERARVALLALLDTASFGESSLGAELLAGVSVGTRFELRGALGYFPPHMVTGVANDDAGGRFSLAIAAFLACAAWSDTAWRLPLCTGLEGGRLSASGTGVEEPKSDAVGWLALRAEASVGFELGANLRATVLGGVVAPLIRHEFSVAGTELLEIPAVSLRAGFGLEYAL